MKLNIKAFALAGGILWSLSLLACTWMEIAGYGLVPEALIRSYYIGYSVTPIGSVIGAVYAFFDAGIGCAIFALIYNLIAKD